MYMCCTHVDMCLHVLCTCKHVYTCTITHKNMYDAFVNMCNEVCVDGYHRVRHTRGMCLVQTISVVMVHTVIRLDT